MKQYKFDTAVQLLKYKVLRSVVRHGFEDNLETCFYDIPKEVVPGKEATMRCCVYKERAIVEERVKMAMGGNSDNPNIIEVLDIACDECPVSSYMVSDSCRGCIAHRCVDACPVGAITVTDHRAHIDSSKCVECGRCAAVCPYSAISAHKRPCELSCKVKAISMDENKKASIDNEKCISCGSCVYQCPFGAIMDKSFILDAVKLLKQSALDGSRVYATVAPSVASQFGYAKLGQVISGLKQLGFSDVVEVALGADMVAYKEAQELVEKGFLTSSCCPAFVSYIEKSFPEMVPHISHNDSPMVELAKFIKKTDPTGKVVFIGPCTAKKAERLRGDIADYVDCVLTFEELQALFDGREIDITTLEETVLDNASFYGRIFARSGGLTGAVAQAVKELGVSPEEFALKAVSCDGIEQCRTALLKASKGVLAENFIEGMACVNGCIGGAGCLTHGPKDKTQVDKYGELAKEKSIKDAISVYSLGE